MIRALFDKKRTVNKHVHIKLIRYGKLVNTT